MTERELEIYNLIKQNPQITHEEISKQLHISKATVAVHISSLINQGALLGRAYVVKEEDYVVGIGAANVDIYGRSQIKIRPNFDHPSLIYTSVGGVTRNILDNLSRLDIPTKLLTAVGDDLYGKMILEGCNERGIDVSQVVVSKEHSSGIFIQIFDEGNDMHLAQCDMNVIQDVTPAYLDKQRALLNVAKIIVFDPSLPEDSIHYLLETYRDKKIFVDTVSDHYAKKMRPFVKDLYAIKPNRSELENLSGVSIKKDADIKIACEELLNQGLEKIYVTLGKQGCYYMDKHTTYTKKLKPAKNIVSASGAGDCFLAGVLYGEFYDLPIEECVDYGLAGGTLALQSDSPIHEDMSVQTLERILKEDQQ